MPTPLDRALNSKNTFVAFAGIITAVSLWSIWGNDIFPAQPDPSGNPETWTVEEMRRWLNARNLHPNSNDSREQLLDRIKANLRIPRP